MKKVLLIAMSFFAMACLADDKEKFLNSYNYVRGVEAIQGEEYDEAEEYLTKEVKSNPKSGYAFSMLAVANLYQEEFGKALNAVDKALALLPKKDKEYMSFAYVSRATVYLALEDTTKALGDYAAALKVSPDDRGTYEKRAQIYYEQQKYDLSDTDYRKMVALNQGDVMGYMGLGRNANAQEKWKEAIEQFDYVEKLTKDYASVYAFRAESYIGLKDWNKATDDIIKALTISPGDSKSFRLMQTEDEEFFRLMVAKLKIQMKKSGLDGMWAYDLGIVYENKSQYKTAIEYYKNSLENDAHSAVASRIANCYSEMGALKSALEYIDMAQRLDSTDYDYVYEKADILYYGGDVDSAIEEIGRYVDRYPEYFGGYYRRGFYKDNANRPDEAIEDYTLAITLRSDYAYSYLGRADQYKKKGEEALARADYLKVTELDTIPTTSSCAQYAFLALGEKEKAIAFNDSILRKFPNDVGSFYDAACLHARIDEKMKAIDYLRQAFEKGYRSFTHIEMDDDMDVLRDMPEFQSLIQEYKAKVTDENSSTEAKASGEEKTVEIPFTKESGSNMCNIKCNINGLPLYFIFDTGASNVSLSQVEATFMMKNGYLDKKDVVGESSFVDATGSVSIGTILNLRNVDIGGLTLTNVKASVVRNQKAPLLLGQSVLGRLGKIEIDNNKLVMKVTYKK